MFERAVKQTATAQQINQTLRQIENYKIQKNNKMEHKSSSTK